MLIGIGFQILAVLKTIIFYVLTACVSLLSITLQVGANPNYQDSFNYLIEYGHQFYENDSGALEVLNAQQQIIASATKLSAGQHGVVYSLNLLNQDLPNVVLKKMFESSQIPLELEKYRFQREWLGDYAIAFSPVSASFDLIPDGQSENAQYIIMEQFDSTFSRFPFQKALSKSPKMLPSLQNQINDIFSLLDTIDQTAPSKALLKDLHGDNLFVKYLPNSEGLRLVVGDGEIGHFDPNSPSKTSATLFRSNLRHGTPFRFKMNNVGNIFTIRSMDLKNPLRPANQK